MLAQATFAACQYEAFALATGRVPTITALVHRHRDGRFRRRVRLGVLGVLAFGVYHFLYEGRTRELSPR